MRAFVSSTAFQSRWGGYRVTYFDADRNPLVSLWGESSASIRSEAQRLLEATFEPIDAILQAAMWRGKVVTA